MIWIKIRRALAPTLSALMLGSLLAAPITAHADGKDGKKKEPTVPIRIDPPVIVHDPQPANPPPPPPKKKEKR